MSRTTMSDSNEKLQPEYVRAVECLDKHFDDKIVFSSHTPNSSMLIHGAFQFFEKRIATKYIPSGKAWRWNQTNARKEIKMADRGITVKILKLIPRKRNTIAPKSEIPSLKIWQFELVHPNKTSTYALWCEKGLDASEVSNVSFFMKPSSECVQNHEIEVVPELKLKDFAFLSKWMDQSVASSFWPAPSSSPW